jgi:hypothetical protein
MVEKYGDYFIRESERKSKIKNGKWFDYSVFNFNEVKSYIRSVRRLTIKLYGSAGDGYHWDHIVPISVGFKLGISPKTLCTPENILKLTSFENLSKGSKLTEDSYRILDMWNLSRTITSDDLF